jgi:hypothetical protein
MPGVQAMRALIDHSILQKQQISIDLQQRLLCWVFGMTVGDALSYDTVFRILVDLNAKQRCCCCR